MQETWWVRPEQLKEEQRKVINLPLGGSYLVAGPPGSGKTNLLLLRAKHLSLAGKKNIAIVVYTRTLREFLVTGGEGYGFAPEKLKTSRKWQMEFLREMDVEFEPPEDYEASRKYFIDLLNDAIKSQGLKNSYETILIDEAQDYLPAEMEIFCSLARTVFAVADRRQKIYSGPDALGPLLQKGASQHALRYHYRNGVQICRLADGIAKQTVGYEPLVSTCQYDEQSRPSSVESIKSGSVKAQLAEVLDRVAVQLKAYPGEPIGIVTRLQKDLEVVWEAISKSPLGKRAILQRPNEYVAFEKAKPICVCTIHSSKGLEFRAIHVVACESLVSCPNNRNLCYTAVTRGKTSVCLYHDGRLPGFVEQALASMAPEPDPPELGDVFKKRT